MVCVVICFGVIRYLLRGGDDSGTNYFSKGECVIV